MKLPGHVCNAVLGGWLQLSCSESVVHGCVVSFLFLDLDSADRVDCRRESFFLHVPESLNSPIESFSKNVMMRHSDKSILFHCNTSLHVKAVGVCCSNHSFPLVDPMRRKEMGFLCPKYFRKGFRRTLYLRSTACREWAQISRINTHTPTRSDTLSDWAFDAAFHPFPGASMLLP